MLLLAIFSLTVTPTPFTAIDASCSGGIAGRMQRARLTPDGRMTRSEGFRDPLKFTRWIAPDDAKALSQRLDRVSFDTMPSLPRARIVYDGVNCTLKREGKVWHIVQFFAGAAASRPAAVDRYNEVRSVLTDVLHASERVTLNPQPIPPKQQ